MSEKDFASLINNLLILKKKGFIKSLRNHSTGIGYTLETNLGIKENRLSNSDWGEIELKAMRKNSNSDISLFVIEPFYSTISNDGELLEKFGYPNINNREILSFVQTIKYGVNNKRNWRLGFDTNFEKLVIIKNDEIIGEIKSKLIIEKINIKINRVVSILAEVNETVNGIEEFWFNEAYYHEGCSFTNFRKAIIDGDISLNPRMRKLPSGQITRNGTAFRIKRTKFDSIFDKSIRLF